MRHESLIDEERLKRESVTILAKNIFDILFYESYLTICVYI